MDRISKVLIIFVNAAVVREVFKGFYGRAAASASFVGTRIIVYYHLPGNKYYYRYVFHSSLVNVPAKLLVTSLL